jgi:hypothetical protein
MPFSNNAKASSDFITGRRPVPFPAGIELIAQRFPITLTTADEATSTVGVVGILPAGCVPVAFEVDAAQLDSGAALAYSLGIVNAAETAISTVAADGGAAWATGLTTGRTSAGAGGIVASRPMKTVRSTSEDRNVGIAITAGSATPVAGEIAVTLYFRAN